MKVRCIGGSLHNKFVELPSDCDWYLNYVDMADPFVNGWYSVNTLDIETEAYKLEVIVKDYKRHPYLIIDGLDVHEVVNAINEMYDSKIKCLSVRGVVYEQL